jgi:hypothetical protein
MTKKSFTGLSLGKVSESLDATIKDNIQILPELKDLIPALKEDEWNQLEKNILQEGCKSALILWHNKENDQYILIDGHNRYAICQKHSIKFNIEIKLFDNLDKVKEWMIDHQLGRRNLNSEQMSYLRGQKYENLKLQGKRNDLTSRQNDEKLESSDQSKNDLTSRQNDEKLESLDQSKNDLTSRQNDEKLESLDQSKSNLTSRQNDEKLKTSKRLAQEFNVGERTIERDAQFAKGIDLIGKENPELKKEILSGKVKINKNQIQALAKLESFPKIESLDQIADILQTEKPVKEKSKTDLEIVKEKLIKVLQSKKLTADMIDQAQNFLNTLKEQIEK